jgi:hypothetical protein
MSNFVHKTLLLLFSVSGFSEIMCIVFLAFRTSFMYCGFYENISVVMNNTI